MNDLTVFSTDLIPVYTTSTGEKVVIGRELHDALKIGKDYSTWFKDMCAYGFSEGNEFSPILGKTSEQGGRPKTEHILKLDMAKHISMIQRTPEGKAIRQKLIELETDVSELSPELRLLINLEVKQKRQDKLLAETNARLDHIGDVIALDTRSWRRDAHNLIVGIANKMGGMDYMRDVQSEIFKLVDQRAGSSLKTRLTNKRARMADEGVCKSKRDKLTKVDIIADDKKLIEIYVAIVKEMAIKNGIDIAA
ncbi:MAG: antA/AntB antirepressor family protein [Ethanoligenens sp.]